MNLFEWTHAFVPGHFIRHYTVDYFFCKLMQKTQKQFCTLEKACFESDFIACHENTM